MKTVFDLLLNCRLSTNTKILYISFRVDTTVKHNFLNFLTNFILLDIKPFQILILYTNYLSPKNMQVRTETKGLI